MKLWQAILDILIGICIIGIIGGISGSKWNDD